MQREEKMKIELRSYAKINLTLDVTGVTDEGMHLVEMVMQQILLCDDISIEWNAADKTAQTEFDVCLKTNRRYLPTDERNLAHRAATIMKNHCIETGRSVPEGNLDIYIKKRIPVAAGLAGGSGNGAAVLHGLNILWDMGLKLEELCRLGEKLGSDVPFCVMGQAAANGILKRRFGNDPLACHCALATGTGTRLQPLKGLKSHLVLSKPAVSISTAKVYKGIDEVEILRRPDTKDMVEALIAEDHGRIKKNMINVLENYTLKEYPVVVYTKNKMQDLCGCSGVLMSGSGPTVFGLCDSIEESRNACKTMKKFNKESFWTRTTY